MEATTVELDAQYRVLREGAGVLPRLDRRLLEVTGSEAADFLQGQVSNDVEALEPGSGCYAALLDRKGHMQADMRVLRTDEGFLIDTEGGAGDAVVRHLSMYKIGRDATVADVSQERGIVSVIGPGAAEVALAGPAGKEHSNRRVEVGGVACTAVATAEGVDLIAPREQLRELERAVAGAGGEPVSEAAAEIVRVEAGRPRFGREMTTATIPVEAGINDRAISFTKGCYIGQETVARLHYKGRPNRHLRGLVVERLPEEGAPVRLGERELGTIGTAVLSPARGPIALAILRREAEPGSSVSVGDGIAAEVVELPF